MCLGKHERRKKKEEERRKNLIGARFYCVLKRPRKILRSKMGGARGRRLGTYTRVCICAREGGIRCNLGWTGRFYDGRPEAVGRIDFFGSFNKIKMNWVAEGETNFFFRWEENVLIVDIILWEENFLGKSCYQSRCNYIKVVYILFGIVYRVV